MLRSNFLVPPGHLEEEGAQKRFQLQHLQGNFWLFFPFYISVPDKTIDSELLEESSIHVENTSS